MYETSRMFNAIGTIHNFLLNREYEIRNESRILV